MRNTQTTILYMIALYVHGTVSDSVGDMLPAEVTSEPLELGFADGPRSDQLREGRRLDKATSSTLRALQLTCFTRGFKGL